ncbi:MAG: hypothetical protein JWO59_719 [Chloroflexi bacterium]|nr:hypothetical protein [Chloroflexota bacterium]
MTELNARQKHAVLARAIYAELAGHSHRWPTLTTDEKVPYLRAAHAALQVLDEPTMLDQILPETNAPRSLRERLAAVNAPVRLVEKVGCHNCGKSLLGLDRMDSVVQLGGRAVDVIYCVACYAAEYAAGRV